MPCAAVAVGNGELVPRRALAPIIRVQAAIPSFGLIPAALQSARSSADATDNPASIARPQHIHRQSSHSIPELCPRRRSIRHPILWGLAQYLGLVGNYVALLRERLSPPGPAFLIPLKVRLSAID